MVKYLYLTSNGVIIFEIKITFLLQFSRVIIWRAFKTKYVWKVNE